MTDHVPFREFGKIPRLSRTCTITEKIDGTNAQVYIRPMETPTGDVEPFIVGTDIQVPTQENSYVYIRAGSRNRWLSLDNDNFSFARWVYNHAYELAALGPGHHYGEWWGLGIQRGYGLMERRWSLFNTSRWADPKVPGANELLPLDGKRWCPACCHVVPVLYTGPFETGYIHEQIALLRVFGSTAAPGFNNPEGVVVYHHAAGNYFKKTIKGDEEGKHAEAHPKKERPPKPPKDPSKGGRRVADLPYDGPDRRKQ